MEVGPLYKGDLNMSNFEDVKKFMETFGQMVRTKPQFPDEKTMQLRYDLIKRRVKRVRA